MIIEPKGHMLQHKHKYLEVSRYAFVGVLTALVDYSSFIIIFYITNNYLVAENLKLPVMLSFNYAAHRLFTFKSKNQITQEIGRYTFANCLIFLVSNLTLIILVNILHFVQLAKFVQLLSLPLFTYVVLNKLVYKDKNKA